MKPKHILFLVAFIGTMVCYQQILVYNKQIFQTLVFSFVPSLFPALFLMNLFIRMDGIPHLYQTCYRHTFGKVLFYFVILMVCMTLGLPSVILFINELKNRRLLTDKNSEVLLSAFSGVSFPFVYGIACGNIHNTATAARFMISFIVPSLLYLIVKGFHIEVKIPLSGSETPFRKDFRNASADTMRGLIHITFGVMLFSLPLFLLERLPHPLSYLLEGFLEFSYPGYRLSLLQDERLLYPLLRILLFPSLSLMFQAKMTDPDIRILSVYKSRLLIAGTGLLLFFLLQL